MSREGDGRGQGDIATHQRLPANHGKLGEWPGTDFPSWSPEGSYPANTSVLDFWPPEL